MLFIKRFMGVLTVMICIFLSIGSVSATSNGIEWEKTLDRNGVVAYSRASPRSRLLETRAAGVINAPIYQLAALLRDASAAPDWLPNCAKGEILEKLDRNNVTTRFILDLPWPLKDRDLITHSVVEYDLDRGRAVCDVSIPEKNHYPVEKGMVRITDMQSRYIIVYLAPGKTGLVITTQVDPGGRLPVSLINLFSKYYAYEQFVNLRKTSVLSKYRELGENSEEAKIVQSIRSSKEKARSVFRNQLLEISNNRGFVDLIVNDQKAFDMYYAKGGDTGIIGEILLKGWGSRESRQEAIRSLLATYLSTKFPNSENTEKVINNGSLIDFLLSDQETDPNTTLKRITNLL